MLMPGPPLVGRTSGLEGLLQTGGGVSAGGVLKKGWAPARASLRRGPSRGEGRAV